MKASKILSLLAAGGEVGHLGGRWWLDLNAGGEMNRGDKFFLYPLLSPGRERL